MKRQILAQLLFVISVCNVSACSGTSDGIEENRDIEAPISYSVPVPVNYFQPALQQGTIEVLEYESKAGE